jgi:hypothetical protein
MVPGAYSDFACLVDFRTSDRTVLPASMAACVSRAIRVVFAISVPSSPTEAGNGG